MPFPRENARGPEHAPTHNWMHRQISTADETRENAISVDENNVTRIGGAVNRFVIEENGFWEAQGMGQGWDDLRIVPGAWDFPGVADPTLSTWQPGGAGATYRVYKFALADEVSFTVQMDHKYAQGTDVFPHVHWSPCDRGNNEGSSAVVAWQADISWANIGEKFLPSQTFNLHSFCDGIDDQHQMSPHRRMRGAGKTISSMFLVRLYRANVGADTWASVVGAQQPGLLEFDFHYQLNTPGSRLIMSK